MFPLESTPIPTGEVNPVLLPEIMEVGATFPLLPAAYIVMLGGLVLFAT